MISAVGRVLQAFLRTWGTSEVMVDGEEAIEAFRLAWEEANPYDVVFLDIMMPRMDRQAALKRIREIERDQTPVIMITAMEDPKNVVEAYYRGAATSYIVKPVTREALEAELVKLGVVPT